VVPHEHFGVARPLPRRPSTPHERNTLTGFLTPVTDRVFAPAAR
jgi:hypothetical protein